MASSSVPDVEALGRELEAARLEAARERARAGSYAEEIRALKQRSLEAQSAVEREEEFLTNALMKKLEQVNSEKREMLMRVEQEEEFLTNSLQKRLDRVVREKHELEVQMAMVTMHAAEAASVRDETRRYASNAKTLNAPGVSEDELREKQDALELERARLLKEKVDLERALEAEQEAIVNKLTKQTSGLRLEKDSLRHEREELRRQVESLLSDKIRLHREKVQLENTLEQEEENIVNRLQTQMLELYRRNRILQKRLERASGSQTPSVVSESDASEDEGGWGHLSGKTRKGKTLNRGGASVYAPSGHAPWERDMYASVSRRRSVGSASASSAGTGKGSGVAAGGMTDPLPSNRKRGDEIVREKADLKTAMSVGGSSATTTPRSSVANTPLTTPRGARSDRGANDFSPSRRPRTETEPLRSDAPSL